MEALLVVPLLAALRLSPVRLRSIGAVDHAMYHHGAWGVINQHCRQPVRLFSSIPTVEDEDDIAHDDFDEDLNDSDEVPSVESLGMICMDADLSLVDNRDVLSYSQQSQVPNTKKSKLKKQATIEKLRQLIILNEDDLEEKFVRGSGPGGQSVNKTSNCVQLRHIPSGLTVHCQETRDRVANRKIARTRLREKLDLLINGESSKLAMRQRRLQRRKSKAQQRANKKYGQQVPTISDEFLSGK